MRKICPERLRNESVITQKVSKMTKTALKSFKTGLKSNEASSE